MPTGEVVVAAEGLTRHYGELLAVDHISFKVRTGEIFGFLGPNGAGKTTTQRMLTGVLPPSDGHAYVLDHDMALDPMGAKEHIGVVPEAANPYLELSGWQNLMLFAELYGVPSRRRRERAEALLREFDLWERRHDRVRAYSKGLRQRLMLTIALIHEPEVIFLDEPTAGLDVASRRTIYSAVRQLASVGTTIFYTTHNIEEANMLCNRVAIICRGRLAAVDSPKVLKAAFADTQAVEVAFNIPLDLEEMPALPQVSRTEKQGDKFHLYTSSPGAAVAGVVDFARERDLQIIALSTLGPSLEEVFVRLTESGDELS